MIRALPFLLIAPLSSSALGAVDLAAQVARARAEVDELAADLEAERAASREELSALARRKTELEGELDLVRRTSAELSALRAAREQARATGATEAQTARGAVLEAALRLRRHVEQGLPFRIKERLARVSAVEEALTRSADVEAVRALDQLVDDELALTGSMERVRHPVSLGDTSVMADVVRVGLAYMVFKDATGNAGVFVRGTDGTVITRAITSAEERARVITLIDAMRRGTAAGAFLVPFPAIEVQP